MREIPLVLTHQSAIISAGLPAYTACYPRAPRSAAVARRLVLTVLRVWRLQQLTDDATLVVTELVANAADHATGTAIRVTITRTSDTCVRIAVVDMSTNRPQLRSAGPDEERGRGLRIVTKYSNTWGVDSLPWGKRVWAECALEAS